MQQAASRSHGATQCLGDIPISCSLYCQRISSETATKHIFQPVDTLLEKMLSKGFPSDRTFSNYPEMVSSNLSSVFQFLNTIS